MASSENHPSVVELLMTLGSNFTKDANEESFFDIAIRERYSDVAFAIIRHDRYIHSFSSYFPGVYHVIHIGLCYLTFF